MSTFKLVSNFSRLLLGQPTFNCAVRNANARGGSTFRQLFSKNDQLSQVRAVHATNSRRAIPPLLWLIAKPVTKLGAILAGRYAGILRSRFF